MVWTGKQLTAKEILGMEPDELKTKLETSASKEDITAVNTKIDGFTSTLDEIRASIAALKPTPEPPPTDPTHQADIDDPTAQILTDPSGFINRTTAGIAATASQARADVLEMRARNEYPYAFSKYGKELMEQANGFSLAQRASEQFWNFHIRTFMGDKYIKGETSGSYPSLVGSGSFAPGAPTNDDPNKGIDPTVADWLKDRGIPIEEASSIKKLMVDQGEPISIENYKKKAS